MGVLRSGARGNMPATAKRLASWRVLKEMLQSFLRRCSLLDVLESLTVGTCVQHFFQVLSRGGGSLAQVFACPGHNVFFPCPILRFACPVFVDKCNCENFFHFNPPVSKIFITTDSTVITTEDRFYYFIYTNCTKSAGRDPGDSCFIVTTKI